MRLERLGNLDTIDHITESDSAGLVVALALSEADLSNQDDKTVKRVAFGSSAARLVDLAHMILLVQSEAPEYRIFSFNCWWLARELFRVMVAGFMPPSLEKQQLLGLCVWRQAKHSEAFYHSPWRGRLLEYTLLFLTSPIFYFAWPVVIVGTGAVGRRNLRVLQESQERINQRFEEYLSSRK